MSPSWADRSGYPAVFSIQIEGATGVLAMNLKMCLTLLGAIPGECRGSLFGGVGSESPRLLRPHCIPGQPAASF